MRIIYFFIDTVQDVKDSIASPMSGCYSFGHFLGKAILFGLGFYGGYWAAVLIKAALIVMGVIPMR